MEHAPHVCMLLGRPVASTVSSVPNLSEGADRISGQPRGDKERGVTNCGRVWSKVPESDARSVGSALNVVVAGTQITI